MATENNKIDPKVLEAEQRAVKVLEYLVNDVKFKTVPSSITHHHISEGGNAQHTLEVLTLASKLAQSANELGGNVDDELVAISALFHDYGKIDVYEKVEDKWQKVKDYTVSLHIQRSIDYVREILPQFGYSQEFIDKVADCIGSHHGRKEWGALWEPRTPEAWILHFADMTSVFAVAKRNE